jgi:hypothetical protein
MHINEAEGMYLSNGRLSDYDYDNLDIYDSMMPVVETAVPADEQIALIKAISNSDVSALETHLENMHSSIDLTEIINKESGYSLLHLAIFKDSDQMVLML